MMLSTFSFVFFGEMSIEVFCTFAWKIPWMEEPKWAAVHGVTKSRTLQSDFTFTFMHWRKKWQPTPVFLPGESQ